MRLVLADNGWVVSTTVAPVAHPDDRYLTAPMWWDRKTYADLTEADQLPRLIDESAQLCVTLRRLPGTQPAGQPPHRRLGRPAGTPRPGVRHFPDHLETIGWAVFALGAGRFAASVGIQTVFLWVLVGLMLVNAAVLSTLYVCYPRDVRKVTATSNTAGRKHSRTPDPPPLQYRSSVLERWRREGERGAIHAGIRSTTARHERIRRCVRAAAVVLAQSVRSR
jgi:hypothetical protein